MQQLSEQAQKLIDDFNKSLTVLSVEERKIVIKKMAEDISILNKEAEGLIKIFQNSIHADTLPAVIKTGMDDISQYL